MSLMLFTLGGLWAFRNVYLHRNVSLKDRWRSSNFWVNDALACALIGCSFILDA